MPAWNMEDFCELHLHGRTGDGKTTLAGKLAEALGSTERNHPFVARGGSHSHTATPKTHLIQGFAITDNPGLLDTNGVEKDEENLRRIVHHVRGRRFVNAFILVVNSQSVRFDSGMQDAVKLLIDSFGLDILNACAIVYTRADSRFTMDISSQRTTEIAELIARRANLTAVPRIRSYSVESNPDSWEGQMMMEAIDRLRKNTEQNIKDLLRWAGARPKISTSDTKFNMEYDVRRRAREAEEKADSVRIEAQEKEDATRKEAEEKAEAIRREAQAELQKAQERERAAHEKHGKILLDLSEKESARRENAEERAKSALEELETERINRKQAEKKLLEAQAKVREEQAKVEKSNLLLQQQQSGSHSCVLV